MKKFRLLFLVLFTAILCGCSEEEDSTGSYNGGSSDDGNNTNGSTIIQGDTSLFPSASLNAELPSVSDDETTVDIPSVVFSVDDSGSVLNLNMTGIQSPNTGDFIKLYGTGDENQNVWLEIDSALIGFEVVNGADVAEATSLARAMTKADETSDDSLLSLGSLAQADLVFLVDNSGSMGDEANTLADQVIEWSEELATVMDMKFACVGYAEDSVSGAIDFTDAVSFGDYLNYSSGTSRTKHYDDNLSTEAKSDASNYDTSGECGVAALQYAVNNFSYRSSANRIYVNLTDEPNQPGSSNSQWSVEIFNDQSERYNWSAISGTIHTVWSGGTYENMSSWTDLTAEDPAQMSYYTSGTTKLDAATDYSNVTLSDLPVTGAIMNSLTFKMDYTPDLQSGDHVLTITIYDTDSGVISKIDIQITVQDSSLN